jgi:hypothetical protein
MAVGKKVTNKRKLRGASVRRASLRGGSVRGPFSYVDPAYSEPSAGAGGNVLVSSGQIVRPELAALRGGGAGCGCGLPAPIAARDMARHEPLYPAIHARLIGGKRRKTRRALKKARKAFTKKQALRGGFTPAIMGPVIDNFGYVAPAVALSAYRYYKQLTSRKSNRRSRTK